MKKAIKAMALFLTAAMISGCNFAGSFVQKGIEPKEIIKDLISEKMSGRLIGTEGNENAAEYIKSKMEQIGLEPYEGSYFMSYKQETADPNEQDTRITVIYKDGKEKELIHGKDFYTNITYKDIDVERKLEFDGNKFSKDIIPVITKENKEKINNNFENLSDIWLVVKNPLSLSMSLPSMQSNFQILIEENIYEELLKDEADKLRIKSSLAKKQSLLNNVVGIIKSDKPANKALVITAHFDHVGKQGDFFFNGALDNATGVSGLLQAADKIKKADSKKDYDIIIAAVNSEELRGKDEHMKGSYVLKEKLQKKYDSLININIDCIGIPLPLDAYKYNEMSKKILNKYIKELEQNNLEYQTETQSSSDHINFSSYYPVVSFVQNDTSENNALKGYSTFHCADKTEESFDYDMIDKITDVVRNLALDADDCFYDTENADKEEMAEKDKKLKFGQAVYQKDMKKGEKIYLITNNACETENYDEFKDCINENPFPEKIGDMSFKNASIRLNVHENSSVMTTEEYNEVLNSLETFIVPPYYEEYILKEKENIILDKPFYMKNGYDVADFEEIDIIYREDKENAYPMNIKVYSKKFEGVINANKTELDSIGYPNIYLLTFDNSQQYVINFETENKKVYIWLIASEEITNAEDIKDSAAKVIEELNLKV